MPWNLKKEQTNHTLSDWAILHYLLETWFVPKKKKKESDK